MGYDIIGDVHGHAAALEALLSKLGYRVRRGCWRHPTRTAVFVGDLIDRGPEQVKTLNIVHEMQLSGCAHVIMGNHEFNAIAYATPHPHKRGEYLRSHYGNTGAKNQRQHQKFLSEIEFDTPAHQLWIDWFLTLPLWFEADDFRVVHACWSPHDVAVVKNCLPNAPNISCGQISMCSDGSRLSDAVETILKGSEVSLPRGITFTDKDGHVRSQIRTRWWDPGATTYKAAYVGPPGVLIPDDVIPDANRVPEPDRPTFIGHYWFNPADTVCPASRKVACVDYSVAAGGRLVAYRFDGETEISAEKFVSVKAPS